MKNKIILVTLVSMLSLTFIPAGTFASYISSVISTDVVHERTHEGRLFSGGYYNASVANGASIDLLIQSHASQTTHQRVNVTTSGDSELYIYTGTTVSATGTAVTMTNHNRQSANTFNGTVTHTPTVTAVGTQLNGTDLVPGGTKSSGGGADSTFGEEFVLATSTNYLLRFTNVSGAAAKMEIHITDYQPNL